MTTVPAIRSRAPQPFQYQGSKAKFANTIVEMMPTHTGRLIEPFAGSAAVTLAAAREGAAKRFWISDLNGPLMALWEAVIDRPSELVDGYEQLWLAQQADGVDRKQYFTDVRDKFNADPTPERLLFLLARCVAGAVRYNAAGQFNQSCDKRRLGTKPNTLRQRFATVSQLLRDRTEVTAGSYVEAFEGATDRDLLYLDPPYEGVSTRAGSQRYFETLSRDAFVDQLRNLNRRGIPFILSYDGSSGGQTYGSPLPDDLELARVDVNIGQSTHATLHGRGGHDTVEALYLSPAAAASDAPMLRPTQLTLGSASGEVGSTEGTARALGG